MDNSLLAVMGTFQCVFQQAAFFYAIMVILKTEIMVAGDHDLVGVGQGAKKIVELLHILQDTVPGQIAGVA